MCIFLQAVQRELEKRIAVCRSLIYSFISFPI